MLNVFNNISYLKDLPPLMFHKIIYSLQEKQFEKNETIHKIDDPTDFVIIVATGELEIMIEIDDMNFVLEKLQTGSVINHLNFFFDEETF